MNSWFVLVLKKKKSLNIVGIPKVLDVTEIHSSKEILCISVSSSSKIIFFDLLQVFIPVRFKLL